MRRVRLADVAEAAGVSVSTASRALCGVGRLAPATRTLVRETAASLGYRPRAASPVCETCGRRIVQPARSRRRYCGERCRRRAG